ncbi:hypothetical protein CSKR_111473 [Clonorchis sinensis]|uniref:Uncharacterized protein n=1 Tax=Clonorchis sinensis TaxID=79923 RepID=A0A419Q5X3_CLOSI|nr:hypothetical protein CSKR_111473 [Clonorchis sinensis]
MYPSTLSGRNTLLIRIMETLRQPTTGFALLQIISFIILWCTFKEVFFVFSLSVVSIYCVFSDTQQNYHLSALLKVDGSVFAMHMSRKSWLNVYRHRRVVWGGGINKILLFKNRIQHYFTANTRRGKLLKTVRGERLITFCLRHFKVGTRSALRVHRGESNSILHKSTLQTIDVETVDRFAFTGCQQPVVVSNTGACHSIFTEIEFSLVAPVRLGPYSSALNLAEGEYCCKVPQTIFIPGFCNLMKSEVICERPHQILAEYLVYDILQLSILHIDHLMLPSVRYSRYCSRSW